MTTSSSVSTVSDSFSGRLAWIKTSRVSDKYSTFIGCFLVGAILNSSAFTSNSRFMEPGVLSLMISFQPLVACVTSVINDQLSTFHSDRRVRYGCLGQHRTL